MNRMSPKKTFVIAPDQAASDCIGALTPGCSIVGVTKGQFSLLDLIRAVSNQIGPAALTVSTWSTGIRDTENLGVMIDRGAFTQVSLCLDRSFAGRQPKYVEEVINVWGQENIRMTRNHAKFFMRRNEAWNIAVLSSMNLNRNPRLEQFALDDSAEVCNFLAGIIDEIFEKMPAGLTRKTAVCDQVFPALLGGGLSDQYLASDLAEWGEDLKDTGWGPVFGKE